jgi:hypothetical protein
MNEWQGVTGMRAALFAVLALLAGTPARAHEGMHHGDHNPHHGGAVMMYKTIHYEVVLLPAGGVQLYLSDEMRMDLPASTVSEVAAEIERPGSPSETVDMAIAANGEYWQGKSRPVTDSKATVHLAFVFQNEPVVVDVPGWYWPALKGKDAAAHEH